MKTKEEKFNGCEILPLKFASTKSKIQHSFVVFYRVNNPGGVKSKKCSLFHPSTCQCYVTNEKLNYLLIVLTHFCRVPHRCVEEAEEYQASLPHFGDTHSTKIFSWDCITFFDHNFLRYDSCHTEQQDATVSLPVLQTTEGTATLYVIDSFKCYFGDFIRYIINFVIVIIITNVIADVCMLFLCF